MKKIRETFSEFKQDFISRKSFAVVAFSNILFLLITYNLLLLFSFIIYETLNKFFGNVLMITVTIIYYIFLFWRKAFSSVTPVSLRLFYKLFGGYGKVISKADWKRIRKSNKEAYKFFFDDESIGHCYFVSHALASWLTDVKLMYCSVKTNNGKSGHSVIIKDNCVYDTNIRRHYDLEEYIEMLDVEIYKIFDEDEFSKEDFFDNIRQDFINWCAERNVYCRPQ